MDETVILGISPFKPMQQTPSVMSLGGQLPHSDVYDRYGFVKTGGRGDWKFAFSYRNVQTDNSGGI